MKKIHFKNSLALTSKNSENHGYIENKYLNKCYLNRQPCHTIFFYSYETTLKINF